MNRLTKIEQCHVDHYGMAAVDVLNMRIGAAVIAAINEYPTTDEVAAQLNSFLNTHLE